MSGYLLDLEALLPLLFTVNHHAWRVIKRTRNAAEFARSSHFAAQRFWFRGLGRNLARVLRFVAGM
jgi:hypothetical protein